MRDKKFIIKPEEKIVVAIVESSKYEAGVENEVAEKCSKITYSAVSDMIHNACGLGISDLDIPYEVSYKGVSKCDAYDVFDEEKGKDIAGNKADMKYHVSMMKKYKRLKDIFVKVSEEMYKLEMEHLNKVDNIKESLQKYLVDQNKNLMTLDETITHIKNDVLSKLKEDNCKECYEEHKQLLLWLEELKKYRELCMDDGK